MEMSYLEDQIEHKMDNPNMHKHSSNESPPLIGFGSRKSIEPTHILETVHFSAQSLVIVIRPAIVINAPPPKNEFEF